jgi:hypothetical protein
MARNLSNKPTHKLQIVDQIPVWQKYYKNRSFDGTDLASSANSVQTLTRKKFPKPT